jgi:hypothetical protein
MTMGMIAEAKRIGAQFNPLGDDYLADPYPFMAEARDAAPVFTRKTAAILSRW